MIDPLSTFAPLVATSQASRPTDPARAAVEFEVLLIQQMLEQLPMPGLEGTEAGTFLSLMHEALARHLVEHGGLGMARQLQGAAPEPTAAPPPDRSISSGFGLRRDPFGLGLRKHHGIDLPAASGTPISAVRPGVVSFAGSRGGFGNLIVIDHGDGLQTAYAHCKVLAVQPGQEVSAGTVIGTVGSTGRSTGSHLHFEVRQDGVAIDPIASGISLAGLFASSVDLAASSPSTAGHPAVSFAR